MKEHQAFIPAALDDAGLTPHQFRVFCRIARRGDCTESVGRIAEATRMTENTVRSALKELVGRSMITKTKRPGTTNLYEVLPPSEWGPTSEKAEEDPSQKDTHPLKHPSQMTGWVPSQKTGEHPSQKTGGASKGYPLEGYPLEGVKSVSAADAPLPDFLRSTVDQVSWSAEPVPDDHPVFWDHHPGQWTYDFAEAAMEHMKELDMLSPTVDKQINRDGKRAVIAQWGDTFRLLHEQDGYSKDEIKETMAWLFEGGNFWTEKGLASVPPLRSKTGAGDRRKFDVVYKQAKEAKNGRDQESFEDRAESIYEAAGRGAGVDGY